MSKDNKKIAPERTIVPCYGDEKIEEAKGKLTLTKKFAESKHNSLASDAAHLSTLDCSLAAMMRCSDDDWVRQAPLVKLCRHLGAGQTTHRREDHSDQGRY